MNRLWKDVEGAPYDDSKQTLAVPRRKKYSREDLIRLRPQPNAADVPEPLKRREVREIFVLAH